ncbi:MAG: DUF504 domain-containing protein [Proteobacteria bacterium]|nr:DUF504 domain-containing protein [Pseudomonadota bacterium]MBU1641576.1 DUF504 domain-containing protein [Pseudomonadota bacterium]
MIAIAQLLNRIRWDKEFGRGDFQVGYYDRLEDRIVSVPFQELILDHGDHFSFQLINGDGNICSIPLHRVRTVSKDGQIIWQRPQEEQPS